MLLVAVLGAAPVEAADAAGDTLQLAPALIVDIVVLTDHTLEIRTASGRYNVDALVLDEQARRVYGHLLDHMRVFRADAAGLTASLRALRPRARTPNIDYEWPADD